MENKYDKHPFQIMPHFISPFKTHLPDQMPATYLLKGEAPMIVMKTDLLLLAKRNKLMRRLHFSELLIVCENTSSSLVNFFSITLKNAIVSRPVSQQLSLGVARLYLFRGENWMSDLTDFQSNVIIELCSSLASLQQIPKFSRMCNQNIINYYNRM